MRARKRAIAVLRCQFADESEAVQKARKAQFGLFVKSGKIGAELGPITISEVCFVFLSALCVSQIQQSSSF